MFGKRGKREFETAYDKRRALMTNRVLTLAVAGVLIYQLIRGFLEPDPTPVWFIFLMSAMIAGSVLLLIKNFKSAKELSEHPPEETAETSESAMPAESAVSQTPDGEETRQNPEVEDVGEE